MRRVRRSRTFVQSFQALLEQGVPKFGLRVVQEKRAAVEEAITNFLVLYPKRPIDPEIGLFTYPVSGTPFLLIYDFDDDELRIHLIVHARSDRGRIDLDTIEW